MMSDQARIERALSFIDSLRVDETRSEYFEVAEQDHSEYMMYTQSQYLLSVMFKLLGKEELYQAIRRKHSPDEPDNDPTRHGHKAGDRFCVLEGDIERFYLAGRDDAESNDEIALEALYWLERKHPIKLPEVRYRRKAMKLWEKLLSRYIPSKGVLEMDRGDLENSFYPVYKVSLLGILAKKMEHSETLANVRASLEMWQHRAGGWVTDRTLQLEPDGVANIETTALAILALAT